MFLKIEELIVVEDCNYFAYLSDNVRLRFTEWLNQGVKRLSAHLLNVNLSN